VVVELDGDFFEFGEGEDGEGKRLEEGTLSGSDLKVPVRVTSEGLELEVEGWEDVFEGSEVGEEGFDGDEFVGLGETRDGGMEVSQSDGTETLFSRSRVVPTFDSEVGREVSVEVVELEVDDGGVLV